MKTILGVTVSFSLSLVLAALSACTPDLNMEHVCNPDSDVYNDCTLSEPGKWCVNDDQCAFRPNSYCDKTTQTCVCEPACSGRQCGDDGCGGSCGNCLCGNDCTLDGKCIFTACVGKACGPDGCGGSCGTCADDGNACNGVNDCVVGACVQVTAPVVCEALDACHLVGVCNPADGKCSNPALAEDARCNDDGNDCNGIDTCIESVCTRTAPPVVCSELDVCHVAGQCAPATGVCSNPPGHEGSLCSDDGDACNGVSTCVIGTCTETTAPVSCKAQDACHLAGVCDKATGQCSNPVGNEGSSCNNGQGVCQDGRCVTGGFVAVSAGAFWIGSPDGEPCPEGYPGSCLKELGRGEGEVLWPVTLTRPFEMKATEVTQGEWKTAFGGWNPAHFQGCGDTCPIENISWFDALAFANWMSKQANLTPCYVLSEVECKDKTEVGPDYDTCMNATHQGIDVALFTLAEGANTPYQCTGYRLPTEAEWEYSARAGSNTAFYPSAGNDGTITQTGTAPLDPNLDKIAWYGGNSIGTHPVGYKAANAWGLYDMSGNVSEWTWDLGGGYGVQEADPVGPWVNDYGHRIERGGSWSKPASGCRSATRSFSLPKWRDESMGVRLARSLITCTPDCAGRTCGSDGCGGTCGTCATGSTCTQTGKCVTDDFSFIQAGTFWMGSPDGTCPAGYTGTCKAEPGRDADETLHQVTLSRPFEMQTTEVTQGEWKGLLGNWNPSEFSGCGDNCPVETVSWYDAVAYANLKSTTAGLLPCYVFAKVNCKDKAPMEGLYADCMTAKRGGIESATVILADGLSSPYECTGYRLPTEAEWEYAARAGSTTAFYPSDGNSGAITEIGFSPVDPNLDRIGWYGGNSEAKYPGAHHECTSFYTGAPPCGPQPAGGKAPNAWGLKDMSGNVWEWCWDRLDTSYPPGSATDPAGPALDINGMRVDRGGDWGSVGKKCRSATRDGTPPNVGASSVGFRLVRSLGACTPTCAADSCGPDGCGGLCSCAAGHVCHTDDDGKSTCVGMKFLPIPGGTFTMGCSPGDTDCAADEYPPHVVTVSPFEMLETEVTEGQYETVMGSDPSQAKLGDSYPVENVSWADAVAFCEAIGGRLPTEAEWEYAARAGTSTRYYCGDDASCLSGAGWHKDNSADTKQAVKGKAANAYGLHDMMGNVWEWTADQYATTYAGALVDGNPPDEQPVGSNRVSRGGGFRSTTSSLRVSQRNYYNQSIDYTDALGFRCVRDNRPAGMKWVSIPAGTFDMGSSAGDTDEIPVHQVAVPAFELLETEVTEGQYQAVTGLTPSTNTLGADYPVETVTWDEAKAFCEAVGGRLPTESEWEYAVRAGTTTKYYCGDNASCLASAAWYDGNSNLKKHPVKGLSQNPFGLYDALGNVFEWTEDWYHSTYTGAPVDGSAWAEPIGDKHVNRGGSFGKSGDYLRVSYRYASDPSVKSDSIGVRCARSQGTSNRWVSIPGGTFTMGCSPGDAACAESEKPPHQVTISAFELLETEVTEGQFEAVMGSNPSSNRLGPDYPVENLPWSRAWAYCKAIGARLPTEAEWEHAARGKTTTRFYCGVEETCMIDEGVAWFLQNSGNTKKPVKRTSANAFGLYDMLGNLWEWTEDLWHGDYNGAPDTGTPAWLSGSSDTGTIRGGSFDNSAENLRVSVRRAHTLSASANYLGFRCARSVCTPSCVGKTCGDNGCGGSCGICKEGFECKEGLCASLWWKDPVSGLVWQNPPFDGTLGWEVAKTYCDELTLDSKDDWRLPTIDELRTLIRGCPATEAGGICNVKYADCRAWSCRNESCDGCSFGNGPGRNGMYWPDEIEGGCCWYWSSSSVTDSVLHAWDVSFDFGSVSDNILADGLDIYYDKLVRCVR